MNFLANPVFQVVGNCQSKRESEKWVWKGEQASYQGSLPRFSTCHSRISFAKLNNKFT